MYWFQGASENDINLDDIKTTDFSNPMYDAFGGVGGAGANESDVALSKKKNNLDNNGTTNLLHDQEMFAATIDVDNTTTSLQQQSGHPLDNRFGSAILSPSSIIHKSSVSPQIRQTALKPTTIDSDKDTIQLVEEDRTD